MVDYEAFTTALREVDAREDVLVTIWQGIQSHSQTLRTVTEPESAYSQREVVFIVSVYHKILDATY